LLDISGVYRYPGRAQLVLSEIQRDRKLTAALLNYIGFTRRFAFLVHHYAPVCTYVIGYMAVSSSQSNAKSTIGLYVWCTSWAKKPYHFKKFM